MPPGRLTKHTGETERKLFDALRNGNTRRTSCALAGISEDSLARYMASSADFAEGIRVAEAEAEAERVNRIGFAGMGGFVTKRTTVTVQHPDGSIQQTVTEERSRPEWNADAWFLERKNPDDWGRRDRVTIDVVAREVERLAGKLGLDPAEIMREAETLMKTVGV